jgi:hypothetical protein
MELGQHLLLIKGGDDDGKRGRVLGQVLGLKGMTGVITTEIRRKHGPAALPGKPSGMVLHQAPESRMLSRVR